MCVCVCLSVCVCVHKSLPGKHQLPRQLTGTLSPPGVSQGQTYADTHIALAVCLGVTNILTYTTSIVSLLLHTHKETTHSCTERDKKKSFPRKIDLKVHLRFFFSHFLSGFLTVIGSAPQIFPALCTHSNKVWKKKGGKKNADRLFHQLEGALLYALTAAAPRKTPLIVPHNFRSLVKWVLTTFARL